MIILGIVGQLVQFSLSRVVGCWGYVLRVAGNMFWVAGDMFCCDGGKTVGFASSEWSLTIPKDILNSLKHNQSLSNF